MRKPDVGVVTVEAKAVANDVDPIGARILETFSGAPYPSWRTTGGIARATGLPVETVAGYIHGHPDFFEAAPIHPSGVHLYGPTKQICEIMRLASDGD